MGRSTLANVVNLKGVYLRAGASLAFLFLFFYSFVRLVFVGFLRFFEYDFMRYDLCWIEMEVM